MTNVPTLIKTLKGYNCRNGGASGVSVGIDCTVGEASSEMRKFRYENPDTTLKLVRVCDACGRSGIENEIVYCCLECEGKYDECRQCHEHSQHYHTDSFIVDDMAAITAATFCFDHLRDTSSTTSLGSLPIEILYEIIIPLHNSPQPQTDVERHPSLLRNPSGFLRGRSKASLSAGADSETRCVSFEGKPTASREPRSLLMIGFGIRARLGWVDECTCGYNDSRCDTRKYFVGTIEMPIDAMPDQVKPFEWRDWHKRTGGTVKVYHGCGGAILVELPEYHITKSLL